MDKHAAYYNGPVRWTSNGPIRLTIRARKPTLFARLLAWLRG